MPRKRKHEAHGEEDVEARWAQHNEHVLVSERQRQAAGASMILQQTGVERLAVGANDAHALVMYLEEHWADGELKMCTKALTKRAHGFANYQKVLEDPLNSEAQRLNTILLPSAQLNMARMILPGFSNMEMTLLSRIRNIYGVDVELFSAHFLRQGPLSSTTFDVHQDTEEFDFIAFTVVVKLTADVEGEPPSAMRVVGASRHFHYSPKAGSAGLFAASLHHASVRAESQRDHLKAVYFFRCALKKRPRRSLTS